MRASDIPLGALLKVPFGTGFVTITLTMKDTQEVPPGYIILWDECSYAYWVKVDADVDILQMPHPMLTRLLERRNKTDQERVSELPEHMWKPELNERQDNG